MKQINYTGFVSDKTQAFSNLRSQNQPRAQSYQNILIDDDITSHFNQHFYGQFLDISTRINGSLGTLSSEIETFASNQNKIFRATFDSSKNDESKIKDQAKTISNMLRKIVNDVENIGKQAGNFPSHLQFFAKNMEKAYKARIQDLATAFRQLQYDYYVKLKEQEENEDIDDIDPFSMPFTNDQITQIQENNYAIEHENQELTDILESLRNILELSDALKNSIFQQGTILDRIDSNVQNTNEVMEEAIKTLEKAETHQKSGMKCMYAYLACMLILTIIFGTIIIIKKKKKEKKENNGENTTTSLALSFLSLLMN